MSGLAVTRHEWEDGTRRIEATRGDVRRYHQLLGLLDLVLGELRKRVGQTYTLEQLAAAYADAEPWARELLDERSSVPAGRGTSRR